MDFQSTIPESPSREEGSRIMHGSPKEGDIEAISWVNWGPVRMGRAGKGDKGREYWKRKLELGAFGGQGRNSVQWKPLGI